MSWKAKPSATMKIARRSEPYLTPAMRETFTRELLPRYATKQGALMTILHEIQHAHGFVAHQAMEEIAEFLGIAPADVLDTVTFYEDYVTAPRGECVIGVCQSIACEVCGHEKLLKRIKEKLGIEPGETTDDGRVTLITMECLGSCDTAPVALVNETLHENLTIDSIDALVSNPPRSAHHHNPAADQSDRTPH